MVENKEITGEMPLVIIESPYAGNIEANGIRLVRGKHLLRRICFIPKRAY